MGLAVSYAQLLRFEIGLKMEISTIPTANAKYNITHSTNTMESFSTFCTNIGVKLNESQFEVAKSLFDIPYAGGKSTLIALLFGVAQAVEQARQDAAREILTDLQKCFFAVDFETVRDNIKHKFKLEAE